MEVFLGVFWFIVIIGFIVYAGVKQVQKDANSPLAKSAWWIWTHRK